jgi:hypothetical protein
MKPSMKMDSVAWITAEGYLDVTTFPIDSVLDQTLRSESDRFRSGCSLLGTMAARGRLEAGVYLVGLLRYYASDLHRLEMIVDQLALFPHVSCAQALLAEIRRVKSSNTTRRYLERVLRSLVRLPVDLIRSGLEDLASDTAFSPKMRAKFREALMSVERDGR